MTRELINHSRSGGCLVYKSAEDLGCAKEAAPGRSNPKSLIKAVEKSRNLRLNYLGV